MYGIINFIFVYYFLFDHLNIFYYYYFPHVPLLLIRIFNYRLWRELNLLLTLILSNIHISLMFCYYMYCIHTYTLLKILTVLLTVILSHIHISLMFCYYIYCIHTYVLLNILTVILYHIHISFMFCYYVPCRHTYRFININGHCPSQWSKLPFLNNAKCTQFRM